MPELDQTLPLEPAAPVETPAVDPWTADSERAQQETAPDETPDTASVVAEPDAAAVARGEDGKFKAADQPKEKKPRNDPQARVQQATAKEAAAKEDARIAREEARQAREEAAAIRARIEALETSRSMPRAEQAPPAPTSAAFPDFGSWAEKNPDKSYEDYVDARTDAKLAAFQQTAAQQQREATRMAAHGARMQAAAAAEPDFLASMPQWDEALAAVGIHNRPGGLKLPPVIESAILDSVKGPQIMRWLGTHPQDALQLVREASSVSLDAVPVMRRYLETAVGAVPSPDSASTVRPSAAKPPINRVGGTASATPVDPDDLEFGPEYMRVNNERAKKAGGRW